MTRTAPAPPGDLRYAGSELELFAHAVNWKAYWSAMLEPYLGRRILDVGAGIGATAKRFGARPGGSYLALEPDAEQADQIRKDIADGRIADSVRVLTGTLRDVGQSEPFDSILYVDVLEHIADDAEELLAAAHLLAPGGCIAVLSPAHQSLFSPFDAAIGHFRRYDRRSLAALCPTGMRIRRIVYLDCAGLLASAANRFFLKASMPTSDQIALWDGKLVPISHTLDRLLGFRFGKTILALYEKE